MAETILVEFAKLLLGQLNSGIVEEVKLVLGVEDELGRIKSNLSSIQAVLKDAEKQQSTSESVKDWLGKLEDVMYDIDDLLDGITTDVKIQEKNKGDRRRRVRKFFSRTNSLKLRWQWAHQIKSLCKKLDLIASEKASFVLSTESADLDSPDSSWRETHSSLNKSDLILGRDDDKEAIINSILGCGDCASLSVVPILGQGGLGKTTLAKLLYNDSKIGENFDETLWVYVSEKFNIRKILKQVISMVTGENILQLTIAQPSLEELRMKLRDAFKDKKYFLVLDDYWNEDSNEWIDLRDLLDVGAKGSTVVVTTRDSKVASNTQTVDEYRLKELSQETCLDLFKRLAFRDGSKRIDPKLLDLANKIVEMSRGLPLLVTSLGNLLCGKTNEAVWRSVIHKLEQGHADILNILKLSYDQLPSNIKLCFRVSSLYGKGAEMYLSQLVSLWTALGFIPSDDQGEEIIAQCVSELSSKSLFMEEEDVIFEDKMFRYCRMHDFVYDLSKSMLGEELARINHSSKEVSEKVRYLMITTEEGLGVQQIPERLFIQAKRARLLKIDAPEHPLNKAFLKSIISRLTFLRVLDLDGCQFEELPSIIGYMKHLRYLDLGNNMRLKQLPSSICNLINLQTILLGGCANLQELPSDIGRLENLRHLQVTTKQEVLPEGIGNIRGLRELVLCDCPRLAFLPMSTTQLVNLEVLCISKCKELDLAHGSWSLQGLNSLRTLIIAELPKFGKLRPGTEGLPFTSLQHLIVGGFEDLMELGEWILHFTSLKTLFIVDCPNLRGFPHTFRLLDKLEKLRIIDCPILSESCTPGEGDDWNLISNIPYIEIDGDIITEDDIQSS